MVGIDLDNMEASKILDSLRQRIDVIDSQLVKLLNDRAGVRLLPDVASFTISRFLLISG